MPGQQQILKMWFQTKLRWFDRSRQKKNGKILLKNEADASAKVDSLGVVAWSSSQKKMSLFHRRVDDRLKRIKKESFWRRRDHGWLVDLMYSRFLSKHLNFEFSQSNDSITKPLSIKKLMQGEFGWSCWTNYTVQKCLMCLQKRTLG